VNGVRLFFEITGSDGVPLVLVHGSWDSHHDWDLVVPGLAESFRGCLLFYEASFPDLMRRAAE
jgi:pimeloyl-ACP methyl ester carboxylesterase